MTLQGIKAWAERGPNRIALSTAVRGMIATATPLVALPLLGQADLAHVAVIGALGVSMVDVGGPYHRRLAVMAMATILGPCLLVSGLHVGGNWWLGALVMAVLALGSGLVRAFGPGGISFGINMSVAFLVGIGASALGGGDERVWAGGYFCGAAWTILVTLVFWQIRPYRRLEQEVAGAWQAVADLVAAVTSQRLALDESAPTRRRGEQIIEARHRALREAIERAHDTVGEARAGTSGPGTTMAQLIVLIASGSRIGAAAVSLSEIGRAAWPDPAARRAASDVLQEAEAACRTVAKILLSGTGELGLAPVRTRIAAVQVVPGGDAGRHGALGAPRPAALAFAQALRNLENAEDALRALRDQRRRLPNLGGVAGGATASGLIDPVRSHLSLKSAIFRHALRVAVVTSACAAIAIQYDLAHGIWLPMTALVVLQPDYGGTLNRAFQRSAGTVAGSIIAGILLVTLRGTAAFDAAIVVLLFATFFLIRRHYGRAIAFLTPLIILLVGLSGSNPWQDVLDRVEFTLLGAVAALGAGYALWPQWERERLPDRLAAAVRAGKRYVTAVMDSLAGTAPPVETLGPLRRAAEIEVTNVDAAFQRVVAEPSRQRGRLGKLFVLTVYIHRLCRHAIALDAQVGAPPVAAAAVASLRGLVDTALEDVARALLESRPAAPRPAFDEPLAGVRDAIGGAGPGSSGIPQLLGQIVSDITALNTAASAAAESTPPLSG